MVIQPLHTGGRNRARTMEAQGAQGRVEDPSPIRVLLWLQGASQGHSSPGSDIVACISRWSANIIYNNAAPPLHTRVILGDDMNRRRRARTVKPNAGQGRVECPATVVVLYRLEEDKDGIHHVSCNAAIWCMQPKQNPSCAHDPAAQLRILLIA